MLMAMLAGEVMFFAGAIFWALKRGFPGVSVLFGLMAAMLIIMTLAMYGGR